jgi:hypothetical protein
MNRIALDALVDRAIVRAIETQDRAVWRIAELKAVGETQSVELTRLQGIVQRIDTMLRELGV